MLSVSGHQSHKNPVIGAFTNTLILDYDRARAFIFRSLQRTDPCCLPRTSSAPHYKPAATHRGPRFIQAAAATLERKMSALMVCARITAELLEYTRSHGNNVSTPAPEIGFPGLKPGDQWCLCASR
jgi:hypothetical protein